MWFTNTNRTSTSVFKTAGPWNVNGVSPGQSTDEDDLLSAEIRTVLFLSYRIRSQQFFLMELLPCDSRGCRAQRGGLCMVPTGARTFHPEEGAQGPSPCLLPSVMR